MQQTRRTLSLRTNREDRPPQDQAADFVVQAIQNQLCVRASYNRGLILLAPHILYTRHQDRFVDGVVIERNGAAPSEAKLGTFKLAGLTHLVITTERFERFAEFDASDPRYAEAVIAALQS